MDVDGMIIIMLCFVLGGTTSALAYFAILFSIEKERTKRLEETIAFLESQEERRGE